MRATSFACAFGHSLGDVWSSARIIQFSEKLLASHYASCRLRCVVAHARMTHTRARVYSRRLSVRARTNSDTLTLADTFTRRSSAASSLSSASSSESLGQRIALLHEKLAKVTTCVSASRMCMFSHMHSLCSNWLSKCAVFLARALAANERSCVCFAS